jgi:uncharacterized protein (DUF488 family)
VPATLLTIGYEKRTIEEYVKLLRKEKVKVLIDVREVAWSHKPGFSKKSLEAAMTDAGIEYQHMPSVGCPKRLRGENASTEKILDRYGKYLDKEPERVREFDRVVAGFTADKKRVCITCFERHPDDCHRSVLAKRWQKLGRGRDVEHIDPGDPRLNLD